MPISYKTAESVRAGHPDKLCDLIADRILNACIRKDQASRVACEVMATEGRIIVAGEITCKGKVNIRKVVHDTLRTVGYNPWAFITYGFAVMGQLPDEQPISLYSTKKPKTPPATAPITYRIILITPHFNSLYTARLLQTVMFYRNLITKGAMHMSFGKMNTRIDLFLPTVTKDAEGFSRTEDIILATVRAYREGRHGNEKWANRAAFSEATDLFRFRAIPNITVTTQMILSCEDGRFDITSVEDVKGRGMYIEVLAKKVECTDG